MLWILQLGKTMFPGTNSSPLMHVLAFHPWELFALVNKSLDFSFFSTVNKQTMFGCVFNFCTIMLKCNHPGFFVMHLPFFLATGCSSIHLMNPESQSANLRFGFRWIFRESLFIWDVHPREYHSVIYCRVSRWWFQLFFIFTPIWGRFPIWLIFFKWVETTN